MELLGRGVLPAGQGVLAAPAHCLASASRAGLDLLLEMKLPSLLGGSQEEGLDWEEDSLCPSLSLGPE